jgi:hypothetical protein
MEELYLAGLQLLGDQLTSRSWQAEPARPATLQETVTRISRLGKVKKPRQAGTTFYSKYRYCVLYIICHQNLALIYFETVLRIQIRVWNEKV